jgi:hypothetical protein
LTSSAKREAQSTLGKVMKKISRNKLKLISIIERFHVPFSYTNLHGNRTTVTAIIRETEPIIIVEVSPEKFISDLELGILTDSLKTNLDNICNAYGVRALTDLNAILTALRAQDIAALRYALINMGETFSISLREI